MKCVITRCWFFILKGSVFLLLVFPVCTGFSKIGKLPNQCSPPANVSITHQTTSSVDFSWNTVFGAESFKVWYYRSDDNYTSQEFTTSNTSISFTNLQSGTYTFYFVTVCSSEDSEEIIVDDLIMG